MRETSSTDEATAGAHAGVELGSVSLAMFASLSAQLAGLNQQFSEWIAEEKARGEGPRDIVLAGSSTTASTGANLVFDCDGPAPGKQWEIRRLAVSGVSPQNTIAGYADFHISGMAPIPSAPSALNWFDRAGGGSSSLPSTAFYTDRQAIVHNPEHLYVVIVGGTDSTDYVITGRALETSDYKTYRAELAI